MGEPRTVRFCTTDSELTLVAITREGSSLGRNDVPTSYKYPVCGSPAADEVQAKKNLEAELAKAREARRTSPSDSYVEVGPREATLCQNILWVAEKGRVTLGSTTVAADYLDAKQICEAAASVSLAEKALGKSVDEYIKVNSGKEYTDPVLLTIARSSKERVLGFGDLRLAEARGLENQASDRRNAFVGAWREPSK